MLLTALACGEDTPPAPTSAPATASAATRAPAGTAPTAVDLPAPASDAAPRRIPDGAPERIRARHLLIAYQGATGADPSLRRTRSAARIRAAAALARVQAGETIEQLARELSDGPSGARGGDLGTFGQGVMNPRFETAAFGLAVGQVSDIVETPFGFHLVERMVLDEVHIAHVLVQHVGAQRTVSDRTLAEARQRAADARARLEAGETVAAVASDLSDGPAALRGGDLGWFHKGQLQPEFEDAAFALDVGAVSAVVASPVGFHVMKRLD